MVASQIAARGIADRRVLAAMQLMPRHAFVPASETDVAYEDRPLPIGAGQTISQPYIVALMSEALGLGGHERVLEIGTGSGYQTAILAALAREVCSIEIVADLAHGAAGTLLALGLQNVQLRTGDGYAGWPEAAPFEAIVVTAAPEHVPPALLAQLAVGGRLVLPVGPPDDQNLLLIIRTAAGYDRRTLAPVRFVPMTGTARNPEKRC
jgi:protein-L-isoaspartate(D-aspartate) O-methyltransferase